jgi:cellulose synthase/poly-beta-1,6-N-acetylglucosamine synthase-like glycosyltransferase
MKIGVIIPTYCRSQELSRCLTALEKQIRPPDEVIVVVRDTDTATWEFLKSDRFSTLSLRSVTVTVPGVVAAMNLGLEASDSDIIAYTDDDAAPHPDWLARMEPYFLEDDRVGGVGGRDWVYNGDKLLAGESRLVGKLQWFGRIIGNHCYGVGDPQEVDVLKGVNMSFRRMAIGTLRFDSRMRGTGAQVHFELAFTLKLKRAGWKLIYDPKIAVDHYPAQRFDEDRRYVFNDIAEINAVHNETVALLEYISAPRRVIFLLWAIAIGNRSYPGLLQWLRFLPSEGKLAGAKLLASYRGRWQGWQTWRSSSSQIKS